MATGCEHPVLVELGTLGSVWWGRCRCCGQDVRHDPDDVTLDPYELALEGLEAR